MDIENLEKYLQLIINLEKNPSTITSDNLQEIGSDLININNELNPMSLKYKEILELSIDQSKQIFEIQCAQEEVVQKMEIDDKDKLDDLIGILNEKIKAIYNFINY